MRLRKSVFFLIFAAIITSICVTKVSNKIRSGRNIANTGGKGAGEDGGPQRRFTDGYGTTADHLMWFVQVSDIHVSIFKDPDRVTHLADLLRNTISSIKPAVVIASGDLTDARDGLGSVQHREEWQLYYETVQQSGVLAHTTWMDLRGNHDTFNMAEFDGQTDFFKNYSVQGASHPRSYSHQVQVHGNRYTFLAVDASLVPGPKRPFNFVGELPQPEIDHIRQLLAEAKGNQSDYLIWFSHYPTSCVMSPGADTDIRGLIGGERESLVYLCGHLHTFGGMVPRMFSLQRTGYLELELGDWMRNRLFRVAAIDHGLFSFVDVRHNELPIVLLTNPKDAGVHIAGREDMSVSLASSHIRLLAFSNVPITECRLRIDNAATFQTCVESATTKSLFTAPWDPHSYSEGRHRIEVVVRDANGRETTKTHHFCLDGSAGKADFSVLGRFILSSDFQRMSIILFAVAYLVCLLPLIFFRLWHWATVRRGALAPRLQWRCTRNFVRKLWLLSSVNRLFYPFLLFHVYLLVGPWMVGEVIDGHTGWVFLWGIFVKDKFLPGTLSYLYAFNQLLLCQIPLVLIYASMVDYKFRWEFRGRPMRKRTCFQAFWPHLPFVLIITVEIVLAVFYLLAYGGTSFVLGPLRTWSIVVHLVLFHQAFNLEEHSLREGLVVWSNEAKPG